jgi:phosphogluconate dehydratase
VFEGAALLGICDKIVPGLLIGALRFGHLPMMMIPGGPDALGPGQQGEGAVREAYAEGKVGREEAAGSGDRKSYHSKGTCTFYGTANATR